MHCESWKESLSGAAIVAGILLAGLRAQAKAEEPIVESAQTNTAITTEGEKQPEVEREDVLFLYADVGDEPSGVQDVLRAIDVGEGSSTIQIEALPAGNILSVRAEPTLSEDAKQKYWIGVQLREVDAALRSHLKLGEGEGVLIAEVYADSPGAKAGLKSYDVIVGTGERKISETGDLIRTVEESGGKELELRVIRAGKEEYLKVTPAERPRPEQSAEPKTQNEEVTRWLGELKLDGPRKLLGAAVRSPSTDAYRYSIMRPSQAIVLSARAPAALPEGTSITITREGKNPAKISVKRDAGTWDVTEDELNKLPDDVRPLVERMLGRPQPSPTMARSRRLAAQLAEPPTVPRLPPGAAPGAPVPPRAALPAAPPQRVRIEAAPTLVPRADGKIQELEDRLKKLEDELRKK